MKKSIIENIKRLYEVSDELIEKRIDKEDVLKIYDYEVLSLDKDYFLAHIKWLKNMKIINNTDYKNLYNLRKERNDIVHNIDKFVFYHDKRLKKNLLSNAIEVFFKVEKWFTKNLDMSIYSATFNKDFPEDADPFSGPMLILLFVLEAIEEFL